MLEEHLSVMNSYATILKSHRHWVQANPVKGLLSEKNNSSC